MIATADEQVNSAQVNNNALTSADHKVIGRWMIIVASSVGVVGAVLHAVFNFERAGEGVSIVGNQASTVFGAAWTYLGFVSLLPAMLGFAVVLVPMQIGATRIANPRAVAFGFWLYATGIVSMFASYISGSPYGAGFALPTPTAAFAQGSSTNQLLWVAGNLMVALACAVVATCVAVTVIVARRPGLKMWNLPVFAWGCVTSSIVLVVSLSVHVGALLVYFFDQRFGGELFAVDGPTGNVGVSVWQHAIYMWQRPDVMIATVLAVALLCDLVSNSMRRAIVAHKMVLILIAASAAMTLLQWAQKASSLASIFPTASTVVAVLWLVPLAAVTLTWLATLKPTAGRRVKFTVSMLAIPAVLTVIGIAVVFAAVGAGSSLPGGTSFSGAVIFVTTVALPLLALVAGVTFWSAQIFGGQKLLTIPSALASLSAASGVLVLVLSDFVAGVAKSPLLAADVAGIGFVDTDEPIKASTFKALSAISGVGNALVVIGLGGLTLLALAAAFGRGSRAHMSNSNGVSLEWVADPTLAHNFESVPPVYTPAPLLKVKVGA